MHDLTYFIVYGYADLCTLVHIEGDCSLRIKRVGKHAELVIRRWRLRWCHTFWRCRFSYANCRTIAFKALYGPRNRVTIAVDFVVGVIIVCR